MSPARTSKGKRASYRLDRVIPGVGRIQAKVGSATLKDYKSADALVTRLAEQGRLDLLRGLRNGLLTVPELRDAERRGALAGLEGGIVARRPLLREAKRAIDAMRCSAVTRDYYWRGVDALRRAGVITEATAIRELATLPWNAIEPAWPAGAADWMRMRRALSAVLSALFGKHHPFRHEIVQAIPRRAERSREPTLTPEHFRAAVLHVPEPMQPILWTIVGVGLRGRELWKLRPEMLRPEVCGVVLPAGKNDAAAGMHEVDPLFYPWLERAIPAARVFRPERVLDAWHRACEAVGAPHTTLHDLRHCFGQWTLDAGVSDTDVQAALRHKTAHMTRLYRKRAQRRQTSAAMAKVLGVPQLVPQEGVTKQMVVLR